MNFIKYLFSYSKNIDELQAYEKALAEANNRIEYAKIKLSEKDEEIEEIYNVNDNLHKENDELLTKIKEKATKVDELNMKITELESKVEKQKDMEKEIKKMEKVREQFEAMINYNYKTAKGK